METDEYIGKKLQEAFKPTKLSDTYKEQLLHELKLKTWVLKQSKSRFWNKPEVWVAAATIVILAIIGYGLWLPFSVWDKLTS
jgi:hypothetical protein